MCVQPSIMRFPMQGLEAFPQTVLHFLQEMLFSSQTGWNSCRRSLIAALSSRLGQMALHP
ncbi:hypothetical protein F6Y32_13525 [Brucella melitensis]|nr:hypothetical protein EIA50_15400 [Brucella abortus]QEX85445.1 hypothetical protein F6Y32_13525 [Brucella melitensis]RUQ60810.1 hypothetical protein ELZ24_10010 [Brucella melitensis]RUQ73235.1 hypothetical protein ELZ17_00420 [Brucella melitensis]RUQ76831.1 hypothetical protein ELZ23_02845 [Brucella abortus]